MDTQTYLDKIERLVEKVEDWSVLSAHPMVSVWMITFNHQDFIRQAIDGVLMQQPTFVLEDVLKERMISQTVSMVFRRDALPVFPDWFYDVPFWDWTQSLSLAERRDFGCLPFFKKTD